MTPISLTPVNDEPLHAPLHDGGALRGSIGLAAVTLAGFGFLYSLAGVGIGQGLFPGAANGSRVLRGDEVVGSVLVAQPFASPRYFQPRPSAADFNPMAASGSNQARTHPALRERLTQARMAVAQRDEVDPATVPDELVTQSGSGLDPHITPEGASLQIARVAQARGMDPNQVAQLVADHTESRQFGVLGQARVNVLQLNLALDAADRRRTALGG